MLSLIFGKIEYQKSMDLQSTIHKYRVERKIDDIIMLMEYNHLFTIGSRGSSDEILRSKEELRSKGIEIFKAERGGKVTYHGPGQLVCYPIMNLKNYGQDINLYLRKLEEIIILSLKRYKIKARCINGLTGVWVGNNKIASIGISVKKWVTMYGFSLNVDPNLNYFSYIIPCGIINKGVTSISKCCSFGSEVDFKEITECTIENFSKVFNIRIENVNFEYLKKKLGISI